MFRILFIIAFLSISTVSVGSVYAQQETIPSWIKQIAGLWHNDEISDQEFLSAIEYLVENQIIDVSQTPDSIVTIPVDDLNGTSSFDIPVDDEGAKNKILNVNTKRLVFKVSYLQELSSNPKIIQTVIDSNTKFASMKNVDNYIKEKDTIWISTPKGELSPLMAALIENPTSRFLNEHVQFDTAEFGQINFPEIFITNSYGAISAMSSRTNDYDQSDESWWFDSTMEPVVFRETTWNENLGKYYTAIAVQITDDNGKYIGTLLAETPIK